MLLEGLRRPARAHAMPPPPQKNTHPPPHPPARTRPPAAHPPAPAAAGARASAPVPLAVRPTAIGRPAPASLATQGCGWLATAAASAPLRWAVTFCPSHTVYMVWVLGLYLRGAGQGVGMV
jgi:hypothetical protein